MSAQRPLRVPSALTSLRRMSRHRGAVAAVACEGLVRGMPTKGLAAGVGHRMTVARTDGGRSFQTGSVSQSASTGALHPDASPYSAPGFPLPLNAVWCQSRKGLNTCCPHHGLTRGEAE